MNPIALITDFGTRDWYVASTKGVLLSISPQSAVVDITHQIAPGNIVQASFILQQCFRHYPQGTVFLVVVDPGVGTERAPITVQAEGYYFVGPDNGLFSFLQNKTHSPLRIRKIENPEWIKGQPSHTFHGRDIFAPAAAWLAKGTPFESVGSALTHATTIETTHPEFSEEKVKAEVSFVDHYGNIITNLHVNEWQRHYPQASAVIYKKKAIPLSKTYGDVPSGAFTAYFGSGAYLEIAVNGGNAAESLGLLPGGKIKLRPYCGK